MNVDRIFNDQLRKQITTPEYKLAPTAALWVEMGAPSVAATASNISKG
jgi:hypothetical protein